MFKVSFGEDTVRRTRSQAEESNRGVGNVKKLLWQAGSYGSCSRRRDGCSAANGRRLGARTVVVVVKRSEAPAGVVIRWVGC